MSHDDVLFGYRLQLFALAGERGVGRVPDVRASIARPTTRWKAQVDRQGLEVLRPRERRRPKMPNQLPAGRGADRRLRARPSGLGPGGSRASSRGRSGAGWSSRPTASGGAAPARSLHARPSGSRWSPATGRPTSRRASPSPSRISSRPAGRAGRHRLLLRRPAARHQGAVWQLTAIDIASALRLGRARRLHARATRRAQTARLARRVARELNAPAGDSNACSPTTATSSAATRFADTLERLGARQTRIPPAAHTPTATSKAPHARSSRSAGGPPSPATSTCATRPQRDLDATSPTTTRPRPHRPPHPRPHPRRNRLRCPQDGGRDEPHLSAHLGVCSARRRSVRERSYPLA